MEGDGCHVNKTQKGHVADINDWGRIDYAIMKVCFVISIFTFFCQDQLKTVLWWIEIAEDFVIVMWGGEVNFYNSFLFDFASPKLIVFGPAFGK